MRDGRRLTLAAPPPDPFGERVRVAFRAHLQLLGGRFLFETDSARLLRIVQQAYARLPAHTLAQSHPRFSVKLQLAGSRGGKRRGEPPPVTPLAGGSMLCGAMGAANLALLSPAQRSALILVSPEMLRYPYHVRYELLEFAVYVLAARVQRLVPLHAACVGNAGRGMLLIGASGAGKSTLMLHCLLAGLDFLAEDSVLVRPQRLLATGIANFLHLRPDALRFLEREARAAVLRRAVSIRRRSGISKLEIDLRGGKFALAPTPQRIRALLFLSRRPAGDAALLRRLDPSAALERLAASQRYAAQQPGWSAFRRQVRTLPAYELRRPAHPRASVAALQKLLERA